MIDIQNEQDKLDFTEEMDKLIRLVIDKTFEYEDLAPLGVSVVITDNENIQKLNKQYREKDVATDVLSFPLYDDEGFFDEEELGDIVISLEKASEQAQEYHHSINREIAFLTAHSMLHLMGYDHEDPDEETEMFGIQEEILNQLGIVR